MSYQIVEVSWVGFLLTTYCSIFWIIWVDTMTCRDLMIINHFRSDFRLGDYSEDLKKWVTKSYTMLVYGQLLFDSYSSILSLWWSVVKSRTFYHKIFVSTFFFSFKSEQWICVMFLICSLRNFCLFSNAWIHCDSCFLFIQESKNIVSRRSPTSRIEFSSFIYFCMKSSFLFFFRDEFFRSLEYSWFSIFFFKW